MNLLELEKWLRETRPGKISELFSLADARRQASVGEAVHLRGLVEISNYCIRSCHYCGIRGERMAIKRYRLEEREILQCAQLACDLGYGTIVLQAGEDPGLDPERLAAVIAQIKRDTNLAVTLSMGEHAYKVLALWKTAGADRYLLKIETTDPALLSAIHPGQPFGTRFEVIDHLKSLGYEVGSGVMIGIPGQTYAILARDLAWFAAIDLDMIGIGPFIPHPDTPLFGREGGLEQVGNDEHMVYKAIALSRLVCPEANIPATTALASINRISGRENGLACGANVIMPNLTPMQYRHLYDIYPNKICSDETPQMCHACLSSRITSIGRTIGHGPGSRPHANMNVESILK